MYWDTEIEAALAYNYIAERFDGDFFLKNQIENNQEVSRKAASVRSRVDDYLIRGLHRSNVSGHKGISWHKAAGKWMVTHNRKYLGLFSEKDDAIAAYHQADQQTLQN